MITARHKEEIKRITLKTLETFGKEYLRAFKHVAIRDAKKERKKRDKAGKEEDSSIEHDPPKPYPGSTPEHPLRPRDGKNKKEIVPELKVKISSWTTFDDDIDPYVAFIVEASLGEKSASVFRRFNQFKTLHKSAKKKIDIPKKTFPYSKFGEGRKFEWDYLHERKNKLQVYMDMLTNNKEMHTNEKFLKWLGLTDSEDPKFAEIFNIAYQNTKWRLWVWKRIPYDHEEEAIAKLAIEEIKREVLYDVVAPFPSQIRATAAATVYKAISAIVGPIVATGWKAAREAVKPLKPKISEIVDQAIDKYLDVEDEVKGKLIEGINAGLSPIVEALEPIVKGLGEKCMDPAFTIVKEIYPYSQDMWKLFDDIVHTGDEKLVDEIEKLVTAKRMEAEEKVNGVLQKSLEHIIGDLSAHVTIDALSSLFSPLKKLLDLVNNVFDVFLNPSPHSWCIKILCEYRAKLEALNPKDDDFKQKVDDLLDQEESWLMWRRYWVYWDYRWKAWSIYWHSYGIPELSTIAKILRKNAFKFAIIHKKWIKRWSYRFGDHLYEKAKVSTPDTWKDDIRHSFEKGYKEANHFFKHRVGSILHKMTLDFFFAAIGVKVEDTVMKALDQVLDPIQKAIPSPIDEILEIDTLARECINASLKQNVTKIVDNAIVDPYVAAWNELTF